MHLGSFTWPTRQRPHSDLGLDWMPSARPQPSRAQLPLETSQPQITLDKVTPLLFQNAKCHPSEQEPKSLPPPLLFCLGSHLSEGTHIPLLQGGHPATIFDSSSVLTYPIKTCPFHV